MAGQSGGHYCDPLYAFMLVYNAVKGNYKDFEGQFIDVTFPYLFVSSSEDYGDYDKYFKQSLPYTADELKELAGMSLDDLKMAAVKLSIEDAAERAAKNAK